MDNSSRQNGPLASNYQLPGEEAGVFVALNSERAVIYFQRVEIGGFVIARAQPGTTLTGFTAARTLRKGSGLR